MAEENVAAIGIKVETIGLESSRRSLESLGAAGKKVETDLGGVTSASGAAGRALSGVGTDATKAGKEISRAADEVREMSSQLGSVASIAGTLKSALAGISVAVLAREFVSIADSANLMASRLKLATANAAEFAEAQRSIYSISQANNVGLKETTALYTRLADPLRKLGGTARETAGIAQALGASLKISGASAAESSAAILQFAQAMASGRLQGDELRSLSEAAPRFMEALAAGLGVGTGALKELGSEGKLTADIVGNALLKSLADLKAEAASIGDSVSGSFQRLQNDALQTVEALDKASGATAAVSTVLSSLSSLVAGVGDVFRAGLADGAKDATSAFDGFTVVTRVLGTALETVMVVGATVGAVLKGVGLQIGAAAAGLNVFAEATAAQFEALKSGNVAQMPNIAKNAVNALSTIATQTRDDLGKVSTDLDKFAERVLNLSKRAVQTRDALKLGASVDTTGSDRKFDGGFNALRAAADEKALTEVRMKLLGVNKEYLESLTALQASREEFIRTNGNAGISEKAYIDLVSDLARKTYAASTAGKDAAKAAQASDKDLKDRSKLIAQLSGLTSTFADDWADLNKAFKAGDFGKGAQAIERLTKAQADLLKKQPFAIENAKEQAKAETAARKAADEMAKAIDDQTQASERRRKQLADQLKDARREGEEIGLTATALYALRRARADEEAAALRSQASRLKEIEGTEALRASIEATADLLPRLTDQKNLNEARKSLDAFFDPSKAKSFAEVFEGAFGAAGNGIKAMVTALDAYTQKRAETLKLEQAAAEIARQAEVQRTSGDLNKALELEGEARRANAKIAEKSTKDQVALYGQLISSTKSFFGENTKGYKALQIAEQAFTAFQLAQDLIKGTSAAAVGVANQAQGDPYSAFARMAAMAAAMASLGFAVSNFSAKGPSTAAKDRQAVQGTGTVLGDASARSESITRAFDALNDSAKVELRYQAGMLAALRNIESAMSGLATLVFRTNGLTSGNGLGVGLGTTRNGSPFLPKEINFTQPQNSLLQYLGPSILDRALGGTIGKMADNSMLVKFLSGLSKTTSEIVDSGLTLAGTVKDLISGVGVGQYATIQSQTKYLGFIKGGSKTSTVSGDLNDELIARQFGLIFSGVRDALDAAAKSLGLGSDNLASSIESFAIEAQQVSLRGLSGAALQEAVSGVISAASDSIAEAFFPGLQRFQQVGEGMLETVLRVASGVESAGYALERFGIKAIDFSDIINAQGDVSGEIVRQSIIAAEKAIRVPAGGTEGKLSFQGNISREGITDAELVLTGVGKIIESLSGSADEIASVYQALLDVRGVMKSVGETGLDLSQAMLRGAGGLEALKSGLDSYLESFFSTTEQTAAATARLGERFAQIGVAMPESNAAFRSLVEGIDTSTEAGQMLYGQVIALAGSFAELYPLAQQAASAIDLSNARRAQEIRILELQGDAAGALALRRADELASMDESLRAQQKLIYQLEDQAAAQQAAAAAAAAAAQAAQAVASERAGLERQILEIQGDTAALRALDLAAVDASNRALLERIHALTDEKAAQELARQAQEEAARAAAAAAEAISNQAKALRAEIFQLENANNPTALRAAELAELDASLRPLQERIFQLRDEAAAQAEAARQAEALASAARQAAEALESQRDGLLEQIFALENAGNLQALRARELSQLDASLRPLQERIYVLQDEAEALARAKAVADERAGIQTELLQLLGDTAALRAQELAALDPSNRALKAQVFAIQDQIAAAEAAQQAAEQAAQAAEQLRQAWASVADGLMAEVDRIRNSMAGSATQSLASLQSQFAISTGQARAGDQAAAQSLPALSQLLLEAARNSASSAAEFRFAQASTAASLEKTAAIARQIGDSAAPAAVVGTQALPSYTIQQPQTVFVTSDPAAQQEIAALKAQLAKQAEDIALMKSASVSMATSLVRIAQSLDNVTGENGDTVAVSQRDGDELAVKTNDGTALEVAP